MRGSITNWDEIRQFFVKRGFDKAKLDKNCFDGFTIVSADIHEPLEGYAVYRNRHRIFLRSSTVSNVL